MQKIKGPGLFLAQFFGSEEPFNSLESICKWTASLGYKGVQIPSWVPELIDLKQAAESKTYADELKGRIKEYGLEITELSTHLQGHLVAANPAYNYLLAGFAPKELETVKAKSEWATQQLKWAAQASFNLGLDAHATFSGSLLWHTVYPFPQRPPGLVDDAFQELANRWLPIFEEFDKCGVDVCFELHPGEDLHDGDSFELFLDKVGGHKRANILYDPSHFCLQVLDYLSFIDHYHERIKAFHVKDAEFNPTGKSGVYGGYQNWANRAGRFRSLGDGQVDFKGIFTKLSQYDFKGWAVVEWECFIKSPEVGALEGARFVEDHIIEVTKSAFDDFVSNEDPKVNKLILGLD